MVASPDIIVDNVEMEQECESDCKRKQEKFEDNNLQEEEKNEQ